MDGGPRASGAVWLVHHQSREGKDASLLLRTPSPAQDYTLFLILPPTHALVDTTEIYRDYCLMNLLCGYPKGEEECWEDYNHSSKFSTQHCVRVIQVKKSSCFQQGHRYMNRCNFNYSYQVMSILKEGNPVRFKVWERQKVFTYPVFYYQKEGICSPVILEKPVRHCVS